VYLAAVLTKFEHPRKMNNNLNDEDPLNPRKVVLMVLLIRSPQNVHSILPSHEHI
jgi:hypothetical protein